MEIIKHGKTYEEPQVEKCWYCDCEFSYKKNEIKESWVRKNAYDSDLLCRYIRCPECGNIISLKDFRK